MSISTIQVKFAKILIGKANEFLTYLVTEKKDWVMQQCTGRLPSKRVFHHSWYEGKVTRANKIS